MISIGWYVFAAVVLVISGWGALRLIDWFYEPQPKETKEPDPEPKDPVVIGQEKIGYSGKVHAYFTVEYKDGRKVDCQKKYDCAKENDGEWFLGYFDKGYSFIRASWKLITTLYKKTDKALDNVEFLETYASDMLMAMLSGGDTIGIYSDGVKASYTAQDVFSVTASVVSAVYDIEDVMVDVYSED